MRLIDADRLKEVFRRNTGYDYADIIDAQTTDYDVEKVIEELEDYLFEKYCVEGDGMMDEIIRKGGVDG